MPEDPVVQILRLVSAGRLSADDAAPLLDALEARGGGDPPRHGSEAPAGAERRPDDAGSPRFARIEVTEGGRRAVDLRIPLALGRRALHAIPGLSAAGAAEIDEAVSHGHLGPILDLSDEGGSGVRIALE